MTKSFKFRLPPLQMCRSKEASSMPHSPMPVGLIFSPINHKAFDISYTNFPDPPPSTPDHPIGKCDLPLKVMPVGFLPRSRSCSTYMNSMLEYHSPVRRLNTEGDSYSKVYNSTVSDDSDSSASRIARAKFGKNRKRDRMRVKTSKAEVNMSTSAENTGWFSNDEHNEEAESLGSSLSSLLSAYDSGNTSQPLSEKPSERSRRQKSNKKVQRSKPRASYDSDKKSQLLPYMEGRTLNEIYAVVKRSKVPYEDFKRSMLEMVLEKQIFEAKDLEHLLFCFLSLNTGEHHAAIVDAFTEVWDLLFP